MAGRWRVSLVLTALLFVLYYGYIILIAINRPFVSRRDRRGDDRSASRSAPAVIVGAWVLTARLRRLGQPPLRPARSRACATAAPTSADRMQTTLGTPTLRPIAVLPGHRRADAGGHLLGGAAHAIDARVLRRRPIDQPAPERPRARRRLHERGVVSRHRRAGRAARLRRDDLRDRLAGRLAGADVPDRRAAAQSRQVHLRRRRRVPAAAGAGADRRGVRRHPDAALLRARADGRRRQPDHADVRHAATSGRSSSSAP